MTEKELFDWATEKGLWWDLEDMEPDWFSYLIFGDEPPDEKKEYGIRVDFMEGGDEYATLISIGDRGDIREEDPQGRYPAFYTLTEAHQRYEAKN